jgi:predicted kinase
MQPSLYMLVGVPGSGKSTWTRKQLEDGFVNGQNTTVVSSDAILDEIASLLTMTYDAAFPLFVDGATKLAIMEAKEAFKDDQNVIWDQTNVTKKSRAKKLDMVPDHYSKIAVFFETPDLAELSRRLSKREGKHIPEHVIESMISKLEAPHEDEGFHMVLSVTPNV